MRLVDRVVGFWRDKVRGPSLRTYDASVEELGGAPWRDKGDTESWFLTERGTDRPATLDTNALKIWKPSLIDRMRQSPRLAWASGGLFSLLMLFILIRSLSTGPTAQAAPLRAVAPPVAVAPQAAPAPSATVALPAQPAPQAAVKAQMSPALKALFDGKSSGKSPKARPAKRGGKKGKRR